MTNSTHGRRLLRTAIAASGFVLAAGMFASGANADYKEQDFAACLERDMPTDYCCEHAGGVMRQGGCIDPEVLRNPQAVLEPATPAPPVGRPLPDVTGPPLSVVEPAPKNPCPDPMRCNIAPPATAVAPAR